MSGSTGTVLASEPFMGISCSASATSGPSPKMRAAAVASKVSPLAFLAARIWAVASVRVIMAHSSSACIWVSQKHHYATDLLYIQPVRERLIIPLYSISLPGFASRHAAEWFHRSTENLCFKANCFLFRELAELSILNRRFISTNSGEGYPRFSLPAGVE